MSDIIEKMGGYLDADFEKSLGEGKVEKEVVNSRPDDLLKKVGYSLLTETDRDEAREKYLSYYKEGEVICTLGRGSNRFNESYVTFFVRDDANETPHASDLTQDNLTTRWKQYLEQKGRKKEDGTYDLKNLQPNQLDPYSTSVMSVQISKNAKTLKSVSRYNHTLNDPDYTYKNLDNLVDGLHSSFYNYFNVMLPKGGKEEIPDGYVQNGKGQVFKSLGEINGNIWGEGFIIKSDGTTIILDPSKQIMADGTLFNADNTIVEYSSLNVGRIDEIKFLGGGVIRYKGLMGVPYTAELKVVGGQIVSFKSDDLTSVGDYFLQYNETLAEL
ncbi:MAG: hypothetical protein WD512_09800, partial [Candidatus Paceibacterota bacterium]